jgi:hypothetical protein
LSPGRNFRALVLDSCVRGFHPIFRTPNKNKAHFGWMCPVAFFVIISNKKQSQDNESSIRGNQDYDAEGSGSLVASVQNRLINKL